MRKLSNGTGSVYKLSGKRTNPWVARKTVGWNEKGHPIYKFIGFYRTRTEAMNALTAYNKSPYSLEGERLCDMYEGFLSGYKQDHSPKSLINIANAWDHLSPLHGESIANLSRKDLQIFFDNLAVTEQVKQKVKTVLKQIFSYSIRYDVIQPERIAIFDYIDLTSQIPVKKINRKVYTPEEIEKLWKINNDMAHVILFLIYTGLRAGEYCGLTENDIENGIIHVRAAKTPAGIRDIPLSDKAQKVLTLSKWRTYDNMKYYFTLFREEHGFNHTFHDTRHSCVSMLTNAGVDERIIQAIVGHRGNNVTEQVYTHISMDVMREALNKI